MNSFTREFVFLIKDRTAFLWLAIAAIAAVFAVALGLQEVSNQRQSIADLIEADRIDRQTVQAAQVDWGDAAYYSFHLTYDEPSDFAFAALGQRDVAPWKHRIRMLALEGQIYESDAGHPDFALIGRFDFAFVVSLLAPLLLIILLHDVRSSERAAGRYEWLAATAGSSNRLWFVRSALRTGLLCIALLLPLWIAGLVSGAAAPTLALASAFTIAHLIFWWGVSMLIDRLNWSSSVNLIAAFGVWLLLAVIAPAAMKAGVDAAVSLPDGGEIMLTQREAVNDAWDLPKEATMDPFFERYPEWANTQPIDQPFEWKWYFAFQQVGDQKTENLSSAYREGREARDDLAGLLAWLAPPALVERSFQNLAKTDVAAALEYEDSVRAYHAQLRAWYYPKLFGTEAFDGDQLMDIPEFIVSS